MNTKVFFSAESVHWSTPKDLFNSLNEEFSFNDDPCPIGGSGGLDRIWGSSTYVNPPYGRGVDKWIYKGIMESKCGKVVVFLLPVRTDTKWFHNLVLPNAFEIRFLKGRLKFGSALNVAPFPSMVIIFKGGKK